MEYHHNLCNLLNRDIMRLFRITLILNFVMIGPGLQVWAQAPELQRDPTGQSGYWVPVGWTVQVGQENNVSILRMDESPGVPESPSVFIFSQSAQFTNAETMLQQMAGFVVDAQVLAHQPATYGEGHAYLQGTIDGIPAKMVAYSLYDPAQTLVFGALFAAPPERFDALGGTSLLFRILERPDPLQQTPSTDWDTGGGASLAGTLDINSYETQLQLLARRTRVDPGQIVGSWTQGISVPMGGTFESLVTGERFYDQLGHGFFLVLHPDQRYDMIYSYSHTFQGCSNTVKVTEDGRFEFDGLTLTLRPARYEGQLQSCGGKPTPTRRNRPPVRIYEIGFDASGQHMVIRGTPPRYVIGRLGEVGQEYIREGFSRQ